MLFITHAITGAALGAATGNPVGGFVAGVVSHHILDWLPHNDSGSYEFKYQREDRTKLTTEQFIMAVVDVLVGIAIIDYMQAHNFATSAVIWGAVGGVLPDLLDNIPYVKTLFRSTKLGRSYHRMHEHFHHTLPWNQFLVGVGLQILLIIVGAAVIFWRVA